MALKLEGDQDVPPTRSEVSKILEEFIQRTSAVVVKLQELLQRSLQGEVNVFFEKFDQSVQLQFQQQKAEL